MKSFIEWTRRTTVLASLTLAIGLASGCENNGGAPSATTTAENAAPTPAQAAAQPEAPAQLASNAGAAAIQETKPADASLPPGSHVHADGTVHEGPDHVETPNDPFSPTPQAAPIAFEPAELDFGILKPGESRTGTIQIRNLSDQPLRIAGSRSSCKCTAVDLANVVIQPGESAPLTASMKPDVSPGPKKAKVRIAFIGYGQISEVDIKAEVALAVRCEPAYMNATEGNLDGEIHVTSLDGRPFRILSSDRDTPDYVDFNPETDTPRNEYTLRWSVVKYDPNNCTSWPGWWVLETDHPDAPVVDLRIRHHCTIPKQPGGRNWFPTSQRVLVGALEPGESYEFTIGLIWAPRAPDHDDHVIVARSRSADFEVELLETDYSPDLDEPELKLRVTPSADVRGLVMGVIELHSIQGYMAEYTVIGRVVEAEAVAAEKPKANE